MFMKRNNDRFGRKSDESDYSSYPKRRFDRNTQWEENGDNEVKSEANEEQSDAKKPRVFIKNFERKKWRLIIRNLPFATKLEDIQNACSKIGRFNEVVLPPSKTMAKKCAGFAFVQFLEEADAEKAKEHFNTNKFLGRMVAADWSLAKDAYETANHDEKEKLKKKVKLEKEDEKTATKSKKFESDDEDAEEDHQSDEEEDGSDVDDEEDSDSEEEDAPKNRPKRTDTAMSEGRVVFVRNVSFDTQEDKLKEEMEKVAEVDLAIICKFKDSGHSKGTAFVHFKTAEDAQTCIRASQMGEFFLDGRPLNAILAVPKESADEIEKNKLTKVPKDNRNLRLLRFGLIREGTAAAKGMSKEDAAKRVKLAETARKKLENLHMFVSPVRIVVHNLPNNMTDDKLRWMCKEAGGEGAYVTECRIWRDKTEEKLGKSKGFAFVTFSEHSHALACLLKLNNNATTFTKDKRPIVEFCIENLSALQAKERRKTNKSGDKQTHREINEKVRKQIKDSVGEIHASGMKFLPKFLGKKLRHRDMTKSQKKKLNVKSTSSGKAGKETKKNEGKSKKKADVKKVGQGVRKNKKEITKYLTLH